LLFAIIWAAIFTYLLTSFARKVRVLSPTRMADFIVIPSRPRPTV